MYTDSKTILAGSFAATHGPAPQNKNPIRGILAILIVGVFLVVTTVLVISPILGLMAWADAKVILKDYIAAFSFLIGVITGFYFRSPTANQQLSLRPIIQGVYQDLPRENDRLYQKATSASEDDRAGSGRRCHCHLET